jgi:hypothetical protein
MRPVLKYLIRYSKNLVGTFTEMGIGGQLSDINMWVR